MPKGKHIDWMKWDNLLGTTPDKFIAEQIGCELHAVIKRRGVLNIDPAVYPTWTSNDDDLLADGKQQCKNCKDIKPIYAFVRPRKKKSKLGRQCLVCNRKYQR